MATKSCSRVLLLCLVSVAVLIGSGSTFAEEQFQPVPPDQAAFYTFDLKKLFYPSDEALEADIAKLETLISRLERFKGEIGQRPEMLLQALNLSDEIGATLDPIRMYGEVRAVLDTKDLTVRDRERSLERRVEAATAFLPEAVRALPADTLQRFQQQVPELHTYDYLFAEWQREGEFALPAQSEAIYAALAPLSDDWTVDLYDLLRGRTDFGTVEVKSERLKVVDNYNRILQLPDRSKREEGFRKWIKGLKDPADLYAFALLQKVNNANEAAYQHKFQNGAFQASLFERHLDEVSLDKVLGAFQARKDLPLRFYRANADYLKVVLGLSEVAPWDYEMVAPGMAARRFTFQDAVNATKASTALFGPYYQGELDALFDPKNRRMDLFGGSHRDNGQLTIFWHQHPPILYLNAFSGTLNDVVTVAHEAAHVVHYGWIAQQKVPFPYISGPNYFTEGFAKVNELLVLGELAKQANSDTERIAMIREQASKLASVRFTSMYWAVLATSFERELYKRVATKQLTKPEQIHHLWSELGNSLSPAFSVVGDLQFSWADTPHFLKSSRGYCDYLYAWLIACSLYERFQSDPGSVTAYLDVMKGGFTAPPGELLKRIGIDLTSEATIERTLTFVETRVSEFEKAVETMKGNPNSGR